MAVNTPSAANGALAAAARVGMGSNNPSSQHGAARPPAPPLFPNSTGGGVRNGREYAGNIVSLPTSPVASLGLPSQPKNGHSKSPSQHAASLATARAPPATGTGPDTRAVRTGRAKTSQRPAVAPKPERFSEHAEHDDGSGDRPTDSTSIAPTTSLVDLFERKSSTSQASGKKPEPIVIKPSKDLAIKSPKPVRTSGGITSMFQMELENRQNAPKPTTNDLGRDLNNALEREVSHSSIDSFASASESLTSGSPSTIVPKRDSVSSVPPAPGPRMAARRSGPSPSPLRNSTSEAINIQRPPESAATSPPEMFPLSSASTKSIPAQYNQLHPRIMTPSMTGDQLADAMVAGSLASSRAPSPRKMEPPPPPTRRQKGHTPLSFSRTPSPAKAGMRRTLRNTESDSSDDDDEDKLHPYGKHKKKRLVRKHPNKHHEGDRKRWRDAVTERERKRYEGVWAANKGMYYSFSREEESSFRRAPEAPETRDLKEAVSDEVSSIVVRDIWRRSRLPDAALETVWDLVDDEHVGRLSKEEFVVGMWLIDQRLKGRKLPVKVSDSVWASVKGLQGIKIRK